MKQPFWHLSLLVAGLSALFVFNQIAVAQTPSSGGEPKTQARLIRLSPPIYPPMARQARIMGDVKIQISIRKDGSVESAEVISGHPILNPTALESAQKSQFECEECAEGTTSIEVTYTIALDAAKADPDPCCCSHPGPRTQPAEAQFSQLGNHIVVTVDPGFVCMCPDACTARWAEEHSHYRSPKCLYLWKCGFRQIYIQ